ncbi:MAG: heme-binding domain-containing protein [Acidobacteria bacterium]|nr:heme-binding domain-containing protein [Acidobacteriota bacterium]
MKRAIKYAVIVLAAAFAVLQLFQIDKTNPPVNAAEALEAAVSVPPDISLILGRSCNDCHSHKTVYPWYTYIQPVGWWIQGHFLEGREELNFSTFARMNAKQRADKLEEMCDEVREGKMPLPSYTYGHRDAVLSETEKDALCNWANAERAKLGSGEETGSTAAQPTNDNAKRDGDDEKRGGRDDDR